jgi:hypothetical protein
MAWDHPIPQGRLAALHDEEFWVPMLGIVSRIARHYEMEAEQAGDLITSGMATGEIGHRLDDDSTWIVTPRGAELVRLAGLSYETALDWRKGCFLLTGGKPRKVSIFWPDVERAARLRNQSPAEAPDVGDEILSQRAKTGPLPIRKQEVLDRMKSEIALGSITRQSLAAMKQTSLPAIFGASRKTCVVARDELLANGRK